MMQYLQVMNPLSLKENKHHPFDNGSKNHYNKFRVFKFFGD